MPRPSKCKRLSSRPKYKDFYTANANNEQNVVMTMEEYECIKLIDYQNMTQSECANSMQVSRTTITNLYDSARKKLADYLINGKCLKIRGGNYFLCKNGKFCKKKCCENCQKLETF